MKIVIRRGQDGKLELFVKPGPESEVIEAVLIELRTWDSARITIQPFGELPCEEFALIAHGLGW